MKKILKINLQAIILLIAFSLSACRNNSNINLTNTEFGSISGRLYFDENSNEICDCECGIEDISIKLYQEKCDGTFQQTIISDEEGYFKFADLTPGNYCVYPDVLFSCEGYFPTSAISKNVILEANQDIMLEWFSYELYFELEK